MVTLKGNTTSAIGVKSPIQSFCGRCSRGGGEKLLREGHRYRPPFVSCKSSEITLKPRMETARVMGPLPRSRNPS